MSFPEKGFEGIDRMPRMKDCLKPEDLDTRACVLLAATVLEESAEAYKQARRHAMTNPRDKGARASLDTCRAFYRSDWFKALSCGLADGNAVMRELDREVGL